MRNRKYEGEDREKIERKRKRRKFAGEDTNPRRD